MKSSSDVPHTPVIRDLVKFLFHLVSFVSRFAVDVVVWLVHFSIVILPAALSAALVPFANIVFVDRACRMSQKIIVH